MPAADTQPPQPPQPPRGRKPDLSAEQEIRARALDAAVRTAGNRPVNAANVINVARKFADYITTGS